MKTGKVASGNQLEKAKKDETDTKSDTDTEELPITQDIKQPKLDKTGIGTKDTERRGTQQTARIRVAKWHATHGIGKANGHAASALACLPTEERAWNHTRGCQ